MRCLVAALSGFLFGMAAACSALAQPAYGPTAPEAAPHRRQPWLIPSPDPGMASHALLFRPDGDGPFRLAVIAHASTENVLRRAQMPQPEYRALAAFLVERGFAVVVPERLGHGATGGPYVEDQGGCDDADYARAGRATAEEIAVALQFMHTQPFIRREAAVVIGHSAGGWGALALARADPKQVAAIVAFAPGRGGHADDRENQVCAPQTLTTAAAEFGKAARVPVTWLVAANDSYFSPALSRTLADAFRSGGAKVEFSVLPVSGSEGHWMVDTAAGVKLAEPALARALDPLRRGARPRVIQ